MATALYSPIALASTVEYGETVDGVVLEKDIQLVYGTANNTKINPGGEQHIKEFGVSSNTEIKGGYQYIEMNGTAEYSVLNDGYQIVQMGGAANQTTLNNGVLQVYGAANDPTIKGGRLIVEKDGITVLAAIEKGGLLEVKEGGLAIAVDQKAGGAIKTTTRAMEVFGTNRLGQFDIKNGIANNMLLENGGSLRVEENDFAYNTTVDSGGLLEVMDGGTVTGVDKKAGGKLIVSTNALEVSGPNSKGQFSIKDGVSKNYELDDGSGLIVMEDTQAIDTILDKHATMQSLGKDTGTKVQANAVYDLGRSYQNGSITYSSKAISENMVINNGRANVWAGTMVNVSVRGNDGILEVMKPQINYAPAMLVGKVVVSEGASFRTHGAVDTSKADVSLENSVWTIIADITTTNQNTLLNLANLAMSDANVIMMAEPVTRSSVTASAENFITLTTNTLSGNGNFYMRTDMANHQSDQLNVTGQATGDFKIFVTDTGASPAAGDSLTLVTTGGGDAAFTLGNAGGVVDIGTPLTPANINEVVGESVMYFRKRIPRNVTLDYNGLAIAPVQANINAALFEWVVENLMKNSLDALQGHGSIDVRISSDDKNVMIDVKDTGKGIPKGNWKRIFEPGFTTKTRGWGLGLSLSRRIVEDYHQGKIGVTESEIGKGTTIRITLKRIFEE